MKGDTKLCHQLFLTLHIISYQLYSWLGFMLHQHCIRSYGDFEALLADEDRPQMPHRALFQAQERNIYVP
jgi:hypothetical protein